MDKWKDKTQDLHLWALPVQRRIQVRASILTKTVLRVTRCCERLEEGHGTGPETGRMHGETKSVTGLVGGG